MNKNCQLIILGNGFDLACGLRSTYTAFFKKRFSNIFPNYSFENKDPQVVKTYSQLFLSKENNEITFWDIFFLNERENLKNKNWNNIEEAIKRVVSYVFYPKDNDWWKDYSLDSRKLVEQINDAIKMKAKEEDKFAKVLLQNYYFSELKKFEKRFEEYIGNEKRIYKIGNRILSRENNTSYTQNVYKKLKILMADTSLDDEHYILSFNYTMDVWDDFIRFHFKDEEYAHHYKIKDIYDIHGYVPTNKDNTFEGRHYPIIFGIDGSVIKGELDWRIPFTKATRSVEIYGIPKDLPNMVTRIDFYGHSLAKADYSYFIVLFEKYNLCQSKLKLYFHYGTYGLKKNLYKNLEIEKEQFLAVNDLLSYYGKEKNNINLFDELISQKRIYFIPDKGARDEQ